MKDIAWTKQLRWDAVTRRDCVERKRRRAAETCQTLNGFLKDSLLLYDDSYAVSSNSRQNNCTSGYISSPGVLSFKMKITSNCPSLRVRYIALFQDVVLMSAWPRPGEDPISTTSGGLDPPLGSCLCALFECLWYMQSGSYLTVDIGAVVYQLGKSEKGVGQQAVEV